jgi:hypothetical protein
MRQEHVLTVEPLGVLKIETYTDSEGGKLISEIKDNKGKVLDPTLCQMANIYKAVNNGEAHEINGMRPIAKLRERIGLADKAPKSIVVNHSFAHKLHDELMEQHSTGISAKEFRFDGIPTRIENIKNEIEIHY